MAIWLQQQLGIRSNPLQCLSELEDGILVQEKISVVEAVTALMGQEVEMANAYKVYAPGGWDDLFYGVEQTNICLRNLKQILGDCTPWTLDIFYQQGHGAEKAFHIDRPASCTICCCNRPTAFMTDAEGNEIGSLRDPYNFCGGLDFEINDPDGNTVLTASSGCCPLGLWCPLPWCPATRDIEMPIISTDSGEQVGVITKRVPGMFKFLIAPDVDDYHVQWQGVQEPEHRALIMAMAMFIDFRYFNDNTNDESSRQRAGKALCGGEGGSGSGTEETSGTE